MYLSNYCDEKEQTWKKNEQEATEKLVNYLNQLFEYSEDTFFHFSLFYKGLLDT